MCSVQLHLYCRPGNPKARRSARGLRRPGAAHLRRPAGAQTVCWSLKAPPISPLLSRRLSATCGALPTIWALEGGSKGGIPEPIPLPAEQACDPTADTIAKAYDNIGWRTQAVRYGDGNRQAQAVPDSLRARSAGLLRILWCSHQFQPFLMIGCSVIHTKKISGSLVVEVDSGNGSLRLGLGLTVEGCVQFKSVIHSKIYIKLSYIFPCASLRGICSPFSRCCRFPAGGGFASGSPAQRGHTSANRCFYYAHDSNCSGAVTPTSGSVRWSLHGASCLVHDCCAHHRHGEIDSFMNQCALSLQAGW
jgi:hypothetical protein